MRIKTELTTKQNISITQQLIQNVEILQMSSVELVEYIYNEAMENPVIDIDALHISELRRRIDWLGRSARPVHGHQHETDNEPSDIEPPTLNTLERHLLFQLSALRISEKEQMVSRYLIACVDPKGYLDEDSEETAKKLDVSAELIEQCTQRLRSFSPKGVCAKNLEQCLLAQLENTEDNELCRKIIVAHMDSLAKGHYSNIAKKLGTNIAAVKLAAEKIGSLSPIPAAGFDTESKIYYSVPDAIISTKDGQLEIVLAYSYITSLKINGYYSNLYNASDDSSVKTYLDKKLKSAEWLINCVSQREKTITACLRVIADMQQDFFLGKSSFLAPMSISDIATRLGVHESTVSRAIRGKMLQCSSGVVPIKSLFNQKLEKCGSENNSTDYAKVLIKALIEQEDKSSPLSDQYICDALVLKGCHISRRTVAKYRDEMNIPSTLLRKGKA